MTIEQFATLMSGIESAVTALAIILGGGWALFTFWKLGEITRSRNELQKLQLEQAKVQQEISQLEVQKRKSEAEILKLEREAKIGEVLEISIKATQRSLPNDSNRYVSAIVEIENKGIGNTRLAYDKTFKPFLVFTVNVNNDGFLEFNQQASYRVPVARSPQANSPSIIVHAGSKEKIPFFFRIDSPGLYLFVFWARASTPEQAIADELGFSFPGNWVAKEYFVVE
jgi:hypothetical protein